MLQVRAALLAASLWCAFAAPPAFSQGVVAPDAGGAPTKVDAEVVADLDVAVESVRRWVRQSGGAGWSSGGRAATIA